MSEFPGVGCGKVHKEHRITLAMKDYQEERMKTVEGKRIHFIICINRTNNNDVVCRTTYTRGERGEEGRSS
jgi:hypothetical protein